MRRAGSLVVPWMSLGWGLVASKSTVIATWILEGPRMTVEVSCFVP